MQKWNVGNYVRELLIGDSGITAYVGEDVYPLVAPENTKGDFMVYQRDKYSKSWSKMGVYEDECLLYVTIITEDYDRAIELASAVDNVLVGEHNEDNYKFFIDLADSSENFEDGKYFEILLLRIR